MSPSRRVFLSASAAAAVVAETTSSDWTDTTAVGNVTTVTLNISKDNVQFGVRAIDQDGNRSPAAFPLAVA